MKMAEFLAGLAVAYATEKRVEVAFFWDPKKNEVLGVGAHEGNADDTWQTAIVNVTQALRGRQVSLSQAWCVSSYTPTAMCLGMLSVCNVKSRIWGQPKAGAAGKRELKVVKAEAAKNDFAVATNAADVARHRVAGPNDFLNLVNLLRNLKSANNLTAPALAGLDGLNNAVAITQRTMPPEPLYEALTQRLPTTLGGGIPWDDLYQCLAMAIVGMTWNAKPDDGWNTETEAGFRAAGRSPPEDRDYGELLGGNNVGAVVVHNNKIIAWGLNVMAQNSTFHAETLAIQTYLHKSGNSKLPRGCRIYSSLQPCDMCAGFITHVGNEAHVIYAMRDGDLKTVLSGANPPNGCDEKVYTTVDAVLDLIEAVRTELARRAAGATTARLKDPEDLFFRSAFIAGSRALTSTFTAAKQQELRALRKVPKRKRNHGQRRRLDQLEDEAARVPGSLGLAFSKFGEHLVRLAKTAHPPEAGALSAHEETELRVLRQRKRQHPRTLSHHQVARIGSLEAKQAVYLQKPMNRFRKETLKHCLELLKVIATAGLSTRYGLDLVMELFELKPAAAS